MRLLVGNYCPRLKTWSVLRALTARLFALSAHTATVQGENCRGGLNPQFMSIDAHFWVKIGFKFQSLGKITNISTSDPPAPSSFRSILTLPPPRDWHSYVCVHLLAYLLNCKVRVNAFVILPNAFWTVVRIKNKERVQNAFVSLYCRLWNTTVPIHVADWLLLGVLHSMTYI